MTLFVVVVPSLHTLRDTTSSLCAFGQRGCCDISWPSLAVLAALPLRSALLQYNARRKRSRRDGDQRSFADIIQFVGINFHIPYSLAG